MTAEPALPIIRRATPADATALAEFAAYVYAESFAADTPPADLDLFLRETYSTAVQEAELRDAAISTYVAEEADGALVAFFQVRVSRVPPGVADPDALELGRFYVSSSRHGSGLAQRLMEAAVAEAASRGAATLWLSTWEINGRARAFYEKRGFVEVGKREFVVGTDVQIDRVMIVSIG
ncbi:MAG: GNAT family N-acetyltransferase [Coriobacteriia bacterium]|nr:GNAT family N-acetyltransferase [Coriobacteriia bacterium]